MLVATLWAADPREPVAEQASRSLELPYAPSDLAMVILLPDLPSGLAEFETGLTSDALTSHTAQLRRREVRVSIPRFKLKSSFAMARTLAGMGMATAHDRAG